MFYGLVIAIHILACTILIAVILLQAGRGGGLSETFGGESHQTIFGTKMSVFLTRATVVAAILFLITSLLLGVLTSRRGRSLIELQRRMLPEKVMDKEEIPLAEPEELPQE